jgi:hypothetical protein
MLFTEIIVDCCKNHTKRKIPCVEKVQSFYVKSGGMPNNQCLLQG